MFSSIKKPFLKICIFIILYTETTDVIFYC